MKTNQLAIAFLTLLLSSLTTVAVAQAALTGPQLRTMLARTGFEPNPSELAIYQGLSQAQVAQKLVLDATSNAAQTTAPDWVAAPAVTIAMRQAMADEGRMAYRQLQNRQMLLLREWWLSQMIATPTPLRERMVLFWHNHFPSSQQKVVDSHLLFNQHQIMRQHALGDFKQLLKGVVQSPAMLIYLDAPANRARAPNENLGRELMELFTLGEGRYTETDVKNAARALTGWSVNTQTNQFQFVPQQHDTVPKQVLGQTINNGDDVLALLLSNPNTAHFLVTKLWQEFISPKPSAADMGQIETLTKKFYSRNYGYDVSALMIDLLSQPALLDVANQASLVKSPVELVVGVVRAFEIPASDTRPLLQPLNAMGQSLFLHPSVKGWATGEGWINANTLLARKQMVATLWSSLSPRQSPAMDASTIPSMTSPMTAAMTAPMTAPMTIAMTVTPPRPPAGTANAATVPPMQGRANILPFPVEQWLTKYGYSPRSTLTAEQRSALQRAVLHAAPVVPLDSSVEGLPALRALMSDIAFQVK